MKAVERAIGGVSAALRLPKPDRRAGKRGWWDYKPNLREQFNKDLPKDFLGERITTMTRGQRRFPVAPSKLAFAQRGQCGRWVYSQGTLTQETYGRDHHLRNFCMWMAGGGVKGGRE